MTNKTVSFVLLFLFLLALGPASAAAAIETENVASPLGSIPAEIDLAEDQLLLTTTGGKVNWSCVGAVAGFTVAALAIGAATGGAGLAVAGAYAPILGVFCL